jgi:uncharacterized membrane protein
VKSIYAMYYRLAQILKFLLRAGTYFPKVKIIITNNCMSCHNSSDPPNWPGRPVKFDTDTDITSLYTSIKSSIADPVSPTNRRMPQTGSLSATDINVIVKWYNKGGKTTD